MTVSIKHNFVSPIADGGDPDIVGPNEWNDDHQVTGLAPVAETGSYNDLTDTPSLAPVATSGAYSDLTGSPTLGTAAALDAGVSDGDVVVVQTGGKLPALDGSQLTGLAGGGDMSKSTYDPTNKSADAFSQDNMADGTTNKNYTATEKTKLAGIAAGADVTGDAIHAATAKTTPVDADEMALTDSAASYALKKVTWANVKATLKTYFDTLYQPLASALTSWASVTRASGFDTFTTTPSSANLRALLTDETGTGAAVFANSPALTTPTGIVKGDVGLGNVDNTSDSTKNSATATLTNKTYDTAGTGNVLKINGTQISDKTGTGKAVLDTSPTISNPQLSSINDGQIAGFKNLLINADGRINQRAPSSSADNTYGHDRWVTLTQTSTVAVSTIDDAENGTPKMWRLSQSQSSAQRMGYAQWIEGSNCKHLRGKSVTLSGRVRLSTSATVRYAICEWTGTADTPSTARDIVNDWTSGTYTGGNFFKSTTFNVLAVGSKALTANTLTDLDALTATVGSSMNNLIAFIWTESTAAQNVTLDGSLQLEHGSLATAREFKPTAAEYESCLRYYQKSFLLGTAPAQNVGNGLGEILFIAYSAGTTTNISPPILFSGPMRKAPSMTAFNTAASNAQIRNESDAADTSGTTFTGISDKAFAIYCTGNSACSVGDQLRFHYTADAEI